MGSQAFFQKKSSPQGQGDKHAHGRNPYADLALLHDLATIEFVDEIGHQTPISNGYTAGVMSFEWFSERDLHKWVHVSRVMVCALLALVFCLLGRDYYYFPNESIEIVLPEASVGVVEVYYTAVPNGDFSYLQSCRLRMKQGKACMSMPLESISKIMICPRGYRSVIQHGHYTNGPGKVGAGSLDCNKAGLTIVDKGGHEIKGITFHQRLGVPIVDGRVPVELGSGESLLYKVEGCPCFPRQIHERELFVTILVALFASLLVLWGLYAFPSTGESRMSLALKALVTVSALFMSIPPKDCATLIETLSTPWCDGMFLPYLLVYPLYLFYRMVARAQKSREVLRGAKFCAVLLAIMHLLGVSFWSLGSWDGLFNVNQLQLVKFAVSITGITFLLERAIILLHAKFGLIACTLFGSVSPNVATNSLWQRYQQRMNVKPFTTALLSLLLAYLPILLLEYPFVASYDIFEQLNQYSGPMNGSESGHPLLNNHQPVAHTLLLHVCMRIGACLGAVHIGFATYSCLQLVALACSVAYFIHALVKNGLKANWAAVVVLYFIFHPVIQPFMFMSVKEVFYTSFLLSFMASLYQLYNGLRSSGRNRRLVLYLMIVSLLGLLMMRNEGRYVVLISSILLLVSAKRIRYEISICLIVCMAYMVTFSVVMEVMGRDKDATRESLSVPLQQVARVYKERPLSITPNEDAAFRDVLNLNNVAFIYAPGCSDPVKGRFKPNVTHEQLLSFLSAWISVGSRNFDIYVQAFINNYFLYFYPDKSSTTLYTYGESHIIKEWQEKLVGNRPDISLFDCKSKANGLRRFCYNALFQLPLLRLFWWPSTALWLFCVLLIYACSMKNRDALSMLILPAILFMVLFAGPTNGDYIRYSYPIFGIFPFIIFMTISTFKTNK